MHLSGSFFFFSFLFLRTDCPHCRHMLSLLLIPQWESYYLCKHHYFMPVKLLNLKLDTIFWKGCILTDARWLKICLSSLVFKETDGWNGEKNPVNKQYYNVCFSCSCYKTKSLCPSLHRLRNLPSLNPLSFLLQFFFCVFGLKCFSLIESCVPHGKKAYFPIFES